MSVTEVEEIVYGADKPRFWHIVNENTPGYGLCGWKFIGTIEEEFSDVRTEIDCIVCAAMYEEHSS